MLVLDLKLNPIGELRKITSSIWFRYARLVELTEPAVLVITPQALVGPAAYRIYLNSELGLDALCESRAKILSALRFRLLRSGAQTEQLKKAG